MNTHRERDQLVTLPVEKLQRGKYQPRRTFDPAALQELSDSIRENGIIQPIVVREVEDGKYEIIAGERRWRAAQLASLETVHCILKHCDDEQASALTLIENIQRQDLNVIEESQAYQRLLKEFHYTHEKLASVLGKARSVITNRLRLLTLDSRVQDQLKVGSLSEGHARILAGLAQEQQYPLAVQCIEKSWSVRKLEQELKKGVTFENTKNARQNEIARKRFERMLSDQLGTEVIIEQGSEEKGGYLRVKFHNADILNGIVEKWGVNVESE